MNYYGGMKFSELEEEHQALTERLQKLNEEMRTREGYTEMIPKKETPKEESGPRITIGRWPTALGIIKAIPQATLVIVCLTIIIICFSIPPDGRTLIVASITGAVTDPDVLKREMREYHDESNRELVNEFKEELNELRKAIVNAILNRPTSMIPSLPSDISAEAAEPGPELHATRTRRPVPIHYPEQP